MTKYINTIKLLDALISKLQANTGGQPILPYQRQIIQKNNKKQTHKQHLQTKPEQKNEEAKAQIKNTTKENKKVNKQKIEKKNIQKIDEDIITFSKVDLRISQIVECWKHPQSNYLYCQKILVGKQLRHIASGLQDHVKLQDMKGKIIVMANLKPRSLGGFQSNGMVVCASDSQNKQFQLLVPDGPLGQRLYPQGFEGLFTAGQQIIPIMNKKTLQKCLLNFKTDNEGYVTWKSIKLRSKAGYIKSKIQNGNVS